jgi:hypothetical protein
LSLDPQATPTKVIPQTSANVNRDCQGRRIIWALRDRAWREAPDAS